MRLLRGKGGFVHRMAFVNENSCKNARKTPESGSAGVLTRRRAACYNQGNKSDRKRSRESSISCGVRQAEVFTHRFIKGFRVGEWMSGLQLCSGRQKRIAGLRPAERRVKRRRSTALWDAVSRDGNAVTGFSLCIGRWKIHEYETLHCHGSMQGVRTVCMEEWTSRSCRDFIEK